MGHAFTLNVEEDGIATLNFDLPGGKVNKFSASVVQELKETTEALAKRTDIRALKVTSGKKGIFIAGADIEELQSLKSVQEGVKLAENGQDVLGRFAELPFPTIAVIDGACLGGGLEFALACDYRVVTDGKKTLLGLPEVTLGIVPGWGGTQRLPKLIGLTKGLEMVLTGKGVPGPKAFKMHMADALVSHEFVNEGANSFVQEILGSKGKKKVLARRNKHSTMDCLLERNPVGRKLVFSQARKNLMKKTKGHYPAPLQALKVIEETYTVKVKDGLKSEAQAIAGLAGGREAKNLMQLFFTSEALKKDPGTVLTAKSRDLSTIKRIGVLGAGVMGGGITWMFARKGHSVVMKDINWDAIALGYRSADKIYKQLQKIRKITPIQTNNEMHRITGTTDMSHLRGCDFIVEAVVENMDIKKKVFAELEGVVNAEAIICTNTSGLPITEIASALKHPERFCGMHFFNPVNRMPLVEVIPGEKTSPETVATVVAVTKKLGKTPIVVKDVPGFLVNRILIPALLEAGWLLEEGADIERVDRLGTRFGLPMGSFVLADEVGLDVAYKVAKHLNESYGERMGVPEIYKVMMDKKLLGKKGGKGFYIHEKGKKPRVNSEVKSLVRSPKVRDKKISDEEIRDRLILVMVNEAARCLEEGVIEEPKFLDMAMIMGTGFPPFRGGLCRYADDLGITQLVDRLEQLAKRCGERFVPAEILQTMKRESKNFY